MIVDRDHRSEILKKVQDQLGRDIDSKIINEVTKHMEECPECKIFVDSVQQTVKIYRETETEKDVPEDVSDRLYKILKLKP